MTTFIVATPGALLIARRARSWTVEAHLQGRSPTCAVVDPQEPGRIFCGTRTAGMFRSSDGGRSWAPSGQGIEQESITAVAIAAPEGDSDTEAVYAGTGPSAVYRSDSKGDDWTELAGIRALPSASAWSFPPRPHTHHVRWIEADVTEPSRLFVAIEAGALVRTFDGGHTWHDRMPGGPYDTHTAATHPRAPGRIYSAAGDGYFESTDAGESWRSPMEALRHRYLVGIAVDSRDPDAVVISATSGPRTAYRPRTAVAFVYRRIRGAAWALAMRGMPEAVGTTASRFATAPDERGVIYAANNRGVFRTADAGNTWESLEIEWPAPGLADGVDAFACGPE